MIEVLWASWICDLVSIINYGKLLLQIFFVSFFFLSLFLSFLFFFLFFLLLLRVPLYVLHLFKFCTSCVFCSFKILFLFIFQFMKFLLTIFNLIDSFLEHQKLTLSKAIFIFILAFYASLSFNSFLELPSFCLYYLCFLHGLHFH